MPDQPPHGTSAQPAPPSAWYGPVAQDDPPRYGVEISSVGTTAVVAVRGEIDLGTAPLLWDDLGRVIGDGALEVVLDLGRLEFIDSSGLSVLIKALKLLRDRQGDLSLRSVTDRTYRVLDVAGLTKLISVDTV